MKRSAFTILWGYQLKNALFSRRGIIWAAIFFLVCLLVTNACLKIQDRTGPVGFRFMLASGDESLPQALIQAPIFSISIFFSSLLAMPFLVLLLRHDIPAREMEAGTLRFFTWRVGRGQLLLSYYLTGVIEVSAIVLSGFFISWIWAAGSNPVSFRTFPVFCSHLELGLRQIPFQASLVAIALFFSLVAGRSRRALGLIMLVFFLFWVFLVNSALAYFSVFKGAYIMGLFSAGWNLFRSLGVYMGINLLFLGGAFLLMRKKDL